MPMREPTGPVFPAWVLHVSAEPELSVLCLLPSPFPPQAIWQFADWEETETPSK